MRHLIGLVLAVVLAAALFAAGGYGVAHVSAAVAHPAVAGGRLSQAGLEGLAALLVTGVLIGILLAVRAVSPLATGLPGLALLAWTALLAVSYHRAVTLVPLQSHSIGAGFKMVLADGLLGLLGAAMVVPLFVPNRWRSLRGADDGEDADYAETSLLR
ncbi:MAG TPA: hypothetical protein VGS19_05990 [Streptosporangiaceae bacterium]|nr:hypothetical protein [Streptosporangiaceae bacterium]